MTFSKIVVAINVVASAGFVAATLFTGPSWSAAFFAFAAGVSVATLAHTTYIHGQEKRYEALSRSYNQVCEYTAALVSRCEENELYTSPSEQADDYTTH